MKKSNRKFKHGLVIGKFYPPHRGHKYLIDTALEQCESVTVVLCYKKDESIPGYIRAGWLQEIHPTAIIKAVEDNKLADDDSKGWATFTLDVLRFKPDAVFTSEDYGDPYATFMGTVHVLVDRDRTVIPISATKVRNNPMKYAQYLEPCVRAYFTWRVAIVGAESTGTTTLAHNLASYFKTVWVPEYGRFYAEGLLTKPKISWTSNDFVKIAEGQKIMEDHLAYHSNGLVICDTDPLATSIWHERYMKTKNATLIEQARNTTYDLYILTGNEIPWINDGTRDGEHIRDWMHNSFIERLENLKKPYIIVSGTPESRLKQSIAAINNLGKIQYDKVE